MQNEPMITITPSAPVPSIQVAALPASDQALTLLKALADPVRLQVIQALSQGERCVCELTGELELAQSRLSFHLRVLRQAGLLHAREQGRWVYYRLEPEALQQIAGWLLALEAGSQAPGRPCC
jgi:ArsR family transcriptional regulator, arsenate/arsenite/antimonite-responsive transcriptional repressor